MNRFWSLVSFAISTCCALDGYAQSLPHGWFVNVDGGAAWPYVHKDLFVRNGMPLASGMAFDHYTGNSPTNGMVGVMAGYQWIWGCTWFPGISVGARYQHLFSDSVNGYIDLLGLSLYRDYQYTFNIAADVLSFYSKLDIFYVDKFFFYVDGGVGVANNQASNYSETALLSVIPRVSPAWPNHNQNNVAFNVGAGLDYILTQKLTLTVGYDYQYLGPMHTGNGVGVWSGTVLSIRDYEANTIFAGLNYFF